MPGSKRICRQCLNDDRYLNNIIASDPDASESCDYCDSEEMTMSMETLAEKVDWLIENYYRGGICESMQTSCRSPGCPEGLYQPYSTSREGINISRY